MKQMINEFFADTNETILREMTEEELTRKKLDDAKQAEKEAIEQAEKEATKAAQAKLAALGLTADDLKALGL